MSSTRPPTGGLRERKKARTRETIQREALRLFTEQGFDGTTVEQIAAAADVAPSTVFRYFPTKNDLVSFDHQLAPLISVFLQQPGELAPLEALRRACRETFGNASAEQLEERRERERQEFLIVAMPDLWASNLASIQRAFAAMTAAVAERTGAPTDDLQVHSFVGAVFGALVPVWLAWSHDPDLDLPAVIDTTLVRLQRGMG